MCYSRKWYFYFFKLMKKLFLSVAVVATIVMAACSTTEKAKDEGADLKAKIESCTNPDSMKVYVQQAQAYAEKLIKEGKDSAAQVYLQEVAPVIAAKDPSATPVMDNIKNATDSVVDNVKDAAEVAGDSIAAKASDVKDAVSDKASDVKDAAAKAVDNTKAKAAEAAPNAADKVKEALGK